MLNKQTIGMHGVFRVGAELTGRGYAVSLTSRSAHGVDMHATTPDLKKTFAIEVKTTKAKQFLFHKRTLELSSRSFVYALIRYMPSSEGDIAFGYYIVPSLKMIKLAQPAFSGGCFVEFGQIEDYRDKWKWLE
jgi:hypothetical protein